MKRRTFIGSAMTVAAAALLTRCTLPGSGEPPQLYKATPKTTFDPALPSVEWQLVVDRPVASAGLNSQKIALQRSAVTLDYFAHANWTDTAPDLIQSLLIASFEATGKIRAVSRESTQLRPDYALQSELRDFQAEYDAAGRPPLVRVRLNAKLIRMPERAIVADTTVERTARAEGSDMSNIVLAFDEALGEVMKRVVEWALKAPGTTARPGRPGL
ncbi:MAG TPA: ABC-type transport auxiliary lipoprotein family protein [Alphaproteobacteria bacterium]|nr:ABC-type transport auxiliary lipoprotein family protein [Alphaproteobacteria bacterium]